RHPEVLAEAFRGAGFPSLAMSFGRPPGAPPAPPPAPGPTPPRAPPAAAAAAVLPAAARGRLDLRL
ncbi:MAG: hypothetical protein IT545_10650, partial [Rhodobacteraceae bacterium]|nr:hypothetical protein [Paracoccaceae bacterium]